MSASPSDYARAARRARLFGALEAASVTRRGLPVDERYHAVERAIVGLNVLDAQQEVFVFQTFADAFAESSGAILAAQPVEPDDEDVTEVDQPPIKVRKVRRFLYWLLPCWMLTSACAALPLDESTCSYANQQVVCCAHDILGQPHDCFSSSCFYGANPDGSCRSGEVPPKE